MEHFHASHYVISHLAWACFAHFDGKNKDRRSGSHTFEGSTLPRLPDSGLHPEISGYFEVDWIFLGNLFLEKYLWKNIWGDFRELINLFLGNVHWQAEACLFKRLKLNA